jgi:hypothetical protein
VAEPWKESLAVAMAIAFQASVEDRPTMLAGVVMEKGVVAGTAVDDHGEDRRQHKSHILFTSYLTIFLVFFHLSPVGNSINRGTVFYSIFWSYEDFWGREKRKEKTKNFLPHNGK